MLPLARKENLTIRELPDQTLVYDLDWNKAHSLNKTAALVWRHCDGQTTTRDLAAILHNELELPAEETLVHLALEQLARRHLLATPLAAGAEVHRRSRRDALKKLAVTLAALPAVMSMAVPSARAAASQTRSAMCKTPSDCSTNGNNCFNTTCTNGKCGGGPKANGTACTALGADGACDGNGTCIAGSCAGSCTAGVGNCNGHGGCGCPAGFTGRCFSNG